MQPRKGMRVRFRHEIIHNIDRCRRDSTAGWVESMADCFDLTGKIVEPINPGAGHFKVRWDDGQSHGDWWYDFVILEPVSRNKIEGEEVDE